MDQEFTKELLEMLRPRLATALSGLGVPRSNCKLVMANEPHYSNWELQFQLRVEDDEDCGKGLLVVRMTVDPFYDGEWRAHFGFLDPLGVHRGGSVPPMDAAASIDTIDDLLRCLLREYDPERWPYPDSEPDDE
jgi:hypothetical protein